MILGVVSGPVEGILTLCIVYAITAIKGGGSFWQQSLLQTIGVAKHSAIPDAIYDMPWNQWYMVYGGVVLIGNTVQRYVPHPFAAINVVRILTPSVLYTLCKSSENRRNQSKNHYMV